jgi:hypothetical protein
MFQLSSCIPIIEDSASSITSTQLSPWPQQQRAHAARQCANCVPLNTHPPIPSHGHSAPLAARSPTQTRKMPPLLQQQATSTRPSTTAFPAMTKLPTQVSPPPTAKRWKKLTPPCATNSQTTLVPTVNWKTRFLQSWSIWNCNSLLGQWRGHLEIRASLQWERRRILVLMRMISRVMIFRVWVMPSWSRRGRLESMRVWLVGRCLCWRVCSTLASYVF